MGGHRTHYSLKMIRHAVGNNTIMMSYLRHSTQLLHPLDVCLFALLRHEYSKAVAEHLKKTRTGVTRALFWRGFARARREAYTVRNIKASWRKAGVVEYNPDNVHHEHAPIPYPHITGSFLAPDIKISGCIQGHPKCQISLFLSLPPLPQISYAKWLAESGG